jgi:hypothetical protein
VGTFVSSFIGQQTIARRFGASPAILDVVHWCLGSLRIFLTLNIRQWDPRGRTHCVMCCIVAVVCSLIPHTFAEQRRCELGCELDSCDAGEPGSIFSGESASSTYSIDTRSCSSKRTLTHQLLYGCGLESQSRLLPAGHPHINRSITEKHLTGRES